MAAQQRSAKPTLMSLARELGVSRQTVSNVINNPDIVSPDTRERVLSAITASGYRPSSVGRALRTQRSMTIAHRLFADGDGINRSVMDGFLHRLTDRAQRHGYRIMLFTADSLDTETTTLDGLWRDGTVDAAILTDTAVDDERPSDLAASGLPFEAFGRPWGREDASSHFWVDVDGAAGTEAATQHLRRLGHSQIGFVGWPGGSGVGDDRRSGWLRAVSDPAVAGDLSLEVPDGASHGASAAAELFSRGATAVVCASDSLALGATSYWRQHTADARTPVIGFDDTPVAAALGMSSLSQPVEAAAEILIERLVNVLAGRPVSDTPTLLKPELVIRSLEPFAQ